jgi:cell division protease FtsH
VKCIYYVGIACVYTSALICQQYQPKRFVPVHSNVKFSDVAGAHEAKQILEDVVVKFIKNPEKLADFGVQLPKGILLYGPPGNGKTLLAKAVAGEAGVAFFETSASNFIELYSGTGPLNIRELFATAKEYAPAIVFIDEIDAIGSRANMNAGDTEGRRTINELLTQLDGFETDPAKPIVVIAATNYRTAIDPAILRSGRFDIHVEVPVPDLQARKAILDVHLKKIKKLRLSSSEIVQLAEASGGMSGADLAQLVNTAGLIALRAHAQAVEMSHFASAFESLRKKRMGVNGAL